MRLSDRHFSRLLQDPETPGSVLLIGLFDEYGTDFLEWEPDTLLLEIQDRWKTEVPVVNRDKIWALVTVLTTDLFWSSLEAFIHVCNALSGGGADFQNWNPADVQEMCWAIAEVTLLDPPEEGVVFSPEIVAYMQAELEAEGFSEPPQLLKPYVSETGRERVEEALSVDADEIDINAYWDAQTRKRLAVDEWVRERLLRLLQEVTALPLSQAQPEALAQLKENAERALAAQSTETAQARESVAPAPTL
jgi:hypothetical protein